MEALTRELSDRILSVIVILTGLLDLLLKRGPVVLRRLKPRRSRLCEALRLFGLLLGLLYGLLRGGNLVLGQVIQRDDEIGKFGIDAGQLLLEAVVVRYLLLVFILRNRSGLLGRGDHGHRSRPQGHCGGKRQSGERTPTFRHLHHCCRPSINAVFERIVTN